MLARMIACKPCAVMTRSLTLFYNNEFINHPDHRTGSPGHSGRHLSGSSRPRSSFLSRRAKLEPKVKEMYLWRRRPAERARGHQ